MDDHMTETEARLALGAIEQRRQQVIDQIDMPRWYWWGLALGWVAVGVVTDLGNPWAGVAATFVFGAGHAVAARRVLSGRHGSRQLSVRRDVVSRHIPVLVIGSLIGLTIVTVALAIVLDADGAEHPVTIASLFAAVVVLCGGPNLMAAIRRRTGTTVSR